MRVERPRASIEAARDPGLIGHDDDREAGVGERAHGGGGAGQSRRSADAPEVVDLAIQGAVAIDEAPAARARMRSTAQPRRVSARAAPSRRQPPRRRCQIDQRVAVLHLDAEPERHELAARERERLELHQVLLGR